MISFPFLLYELKRFIGEFYSPIKEGVIKYTTRKATMSTCLLDIIISLHRYSSFAILIKKD